MLATAAEQKTLSLAFIHMVKIIFEFCELMEYCVLKETLKGQISICFENYKLAKEKRKSMSAKVSAIHCSGSYNKNLTTIHISNTCSSLDQIQNIKI